MSGLGRWRQPVVTLAGMIVVVGLTASVDPKPGALILGAVLAMSLSRNRLVSTWRGRAEAIILLPVTALATIGVGELLLHIPALGAAAFVAGMFLSIWLRRFGPVWHRVGSLIALPFITLLVVPGGGSGTTPLVAVLLSVVALVVVVAVRLLAEFTHLLARPARSDMPADAPTGPVVPPRTSALRPIPSTRMAIQMAIATSVGWAAGFLLFPQHVSWVVLTAFLVCSGNRGRADVLHKSGLRIAGAVVGSLAAGVLAFVEPHGAHAFVEGPALVVLLLAVIGIGLWLRETTYAAWALTVTLAISLIQQEVGPVRGADVATLWLRVLAIVLGAAIGLAASWFVLPVRSEGVVRLRIADALRALSDLVDERSVANDHRLDRALDRLDEVARPWRAWSRIARWRPDERQPGRWMLLVHESAALTREAESVPPQARRALGAARRSMRDPEAIGPALVALRDELAVTPGADAGSAAAAPE